MEKDIEVRELSRIDKDETGLLSITAIQSLNIKESVVKKNLKSRRKISHKYLHNDFCLIFALHQRKGGIHAIYR